ncbi:helix-turn-helix domain-containing protein [Rhodococcus rhodochrous]|uniref:helix-turn-helix domain-containing protein n=1 Tax=Rhodococcus rhodochrous TaxID=1829 RepID=UPI002F90CA35
MDTLPGTVEGRMVSVQLFQTQELSVSAVSVDRSASVGAGLRQVRIARGMTLRGLARCIDVSPATLSQIENDKTGLTVDRLNRIADALGVRPAEILEAGRAALTAPAEEPETLVATRSDPPGQVEACRQWRVYEPLSLVPVLQAALEEILAVGYHGTSMREISKRCGLSVPGIYNYFTSKQDILMTIYQATMDDLEQRTRGALAEGAGRDPVTVFTLLIENLALYHTHRRELGFIGASEMRSLTTENRRIIANKRNWQQAVVDEKVLAAVRAGSFRVRNPEDAARAVVSMCTALPTWWRPGGRMSPEEVANLYVEYALDLMQYRGTDLDRGP